MFKRFTPSDSISTTNKVKNSAGRAIHSQIVEQYPALEECIETLLPAKGMMVGKAEDNVQLLLVDGQILFWQDKGIGPWMPTIRLLHKYPAMMKRMQVDKGAIRYVLGGANIMAPGFTNPGGSMPEPIEEGEPVSIYADGKQHCMALGVTKKSTADIAKDKKGMAVETMHYIGDGLFTDDKF
jgi:malignant T-cell-amplified sequence